MLHFFILYISSSFLNIYKMEEILFSKGNLPFAVDSTNGWTESQFYQLKNQIIAYKYLIRNMGVPSEILEKIRGSEMEEWDKMREKNLEKIQETYEKRFEDHDLSMKELGLYFKKRMKDQEIIPRLFADRNYGEEIEYNADTEVENRKLKLANYLSHIKDGKENRDIKENLRANSIIKAEEKLNCADNFFGGEEEIFNRNGNGVCMTSTAEESTSNNNINNNYIVQDDLIKSAQTELKLLKIYNLQKKVRKEVLFNFVNDFEKQNSVYYSDMLFYKTLLDRRFYKRAPNPTDRKDRKLNERFEQQLRSGYDIRKKEKHREFLNQLMQHQRDFGEFHFKNKRQALKKRAQQVKQYIDNIEKKDQQEKEKRERERIMLLKQNNIEGYLKMINEAKDARLVEFMNQTDMFLKEIEDKISVQKEITQKIIKQQEEIIQDVEMDIDQDEEMNSNIDGEEGHEENKNGHIKKSLIHIEEEKDEKMREKVSNSKNYYLTAHSVLEEIKEQPKLLKSGQLKSYQLVGLQWLVSLYVNNLNGILADEMGLGKTIQTISLICYVIEKKFNYGPFLIVVPLSTISNWVLEFAKWAPDIKLVTYKGPPNLRRQLAYQIKNEKNRFNVVLTTYEYIMKDKYFLNKICWQYIIVDEGHRMKNSKSKFTQTLGTQFNSVYRLLLTGTPLQNNLSELWALLNFLLPKIFNSCEDFEKWFNQPFNNKLTVERTSDLNEEQQLLIINRLHTVLRPFLLRREKKDVEKELPNKLEFVIKVELSAWQKVIYHQIKEKGVHARDPSTGKFGSKALMNTMMQLRKICNHPYLFLDNNNSLYDHVDDMIYRASGKFELLDKMVPKLLTAGHKILIFSQMTQLMDIMQLFFDYKGFKHLRLDGNTKADDRGNQMEMFNDPNSEFKIFILSTRAGGLGLNLQTADTVIIFDSDWNPQMDIQAQDRAHRIGQKHEVRVFRFITQTAIEEEILSKAAFKKNLDDKIIRAGLYNVKYSEHERRKKLEDLLKNDKEEDEEEDEIPTDEQINEMLARNEDEFKLYEQMDKERYERENRDEKIKYIEKRCNIDMSTVKNINYRLLQDYEVPDWIHIRNPEVKEEEIMGKGMRNRPKVNYKDEYDDYQFLVEDDEDESQNENEIGKRKKRRADQKLENLGEKKRRIEDDENYVNDEDEGDSFSISIPRSKKSSSLLNNKNSKMKIQITMGNF
jgi:SNF2 family DNA or RNA helicase